jgi:hypothetical protein
MKGRAYLTLINEVCKYIPRVLPKTRKYTVFKIEKTFRLSKFFSLYDTFHIVDLKIQMKHENEEGMMRKYEDRIKKIILKILK